MIFNDRNDRISCVQGSISVKSWEIREFTKKTTPITKRKRHKFVCVISRKQVPHSLHSLHITLVLLDLHAPPEHFSSCDIFACRLMPENNDLIGLMKKKKLAARAALTLTHHFDIGKIVMFAPMFIFNRNFGCRSRRRLSKTQNCLHFQS